MPTKTPATLAEAEKTAAEKLADLKAQQEALMSEIKAENQPLIDEVTSILSNEDLKASMVRLAEIGQRLPQENPYINLRMMLNSVHQSFGGAVMALGEAVK